MDRFFDSVPDQFLQTAQGCSEQEIDNLEHTLQKKIPKSLREYLLIFGKNQTFFLEWDWHGYKDMITLQDSLNYWIKFWQEKSIYVSELKSAVCFFRFQDTFFYVLQGAGDDPSIYSLDIGDEPTIEKRNNHLSDFIKDWMQHTLSGEFW